jgi:hypothetical protein
MLVLEKYLIYVIAQDKKNKMHKYIHKYIYAFIYIYIVY